MGTEELDAEAGDAVPEELEPDLPADGDVRDTISEQAIILDGEYLFDAETGDFYQVQNNNLNKLKKISKETE